jgi:anti-sigma factor RsiW
MYVGRYRMSCPNPIDPAILADYWLAELAPNDESAVEEHIFDCEDCTRQLQSVIDLAEGIRTLARQGNLGMVVTREFLDRLTREGLRAREYAPQAGGAVACTVTAQDDLLIGRLAADLTGIERVDVALCDPSGAERQRLQDIPFRGGLTEVMLNYPIGMARQSGPDVLVMKVLAVTKEGERVLGEYTFNHTPSA